MSRQLKAIFFLSSLLSTNAYKLSFYNDADTCAGEFLGSWVGGPAQGCQQEFVLVHPALPFVGIALIYITGTASSVMVESTGPADDDTNTIARFYSSSDCLDGTQIAEGNVDCITVSGGGIASYLSYKIDYTPLSNLPIISGAVSGSLVTATESIVVRSPQTKTRASSTPISTQKSKPFTHGDVRQFEGVAYRLQQVYNGGFMGIRVDEWDDNINVPNFAPPPPAKDMVGVSQNLTTRHGELNERNGNSICQSTVRCSNRLIFQATQGGIALAGVFREYLSAAAAQASQSQQQLGVFLEKHPFFREILFDLIAGISGTGTSILVGATLQSGNTNAIQSCSVDGTQLTAIAQAFEDRMSTLLRASAVTVTMFETVTDTVTKITMSTVECGVLNESDQCGLPTGICI